MLQSFIPEDRHFAKILVIEDDLDMARLEEKILGDFGYIVESAQNGNEAYNALHVFQPDVILIDIGLPDTNGFDLLKNITSMTHAYCIVVSAKGEEGDVLRGLNHGADDYLRKPFSQHELLARIGAFLRRRRRETQPKVQLLTPAGDVLIDSNKRAMKRGEHSVQLTELEYQLLHLFAKKPDKLHTRAKIMETIWKDITGIQTRSLDVHSASLRRKFRRIGSTNSIKNVRGIGYLLDTSHSAS